MTTALLGSRRRPRRDDRDRPAAVRPLMLGAAGDVDFRVADEAGERAGDEGARVAGGGDVAVVEHRVAEAAQFPVRARLGLGEQRDDARPLIRRQLALGASGPSSRKSPPHRIDVDGVAHHAMVEFATVRPNGPRRRARRFRDRPVPRRRKPKRAKRTATSRGRSTSSVMRARSTSPRATATPSAEAARERPIDFSCPASPWSVAAPLDIGDPVGGEQWAFDLHEMDVVRGAEAGVRHCGAHALGDVGDLASRPRLRRGAARCAHGQLRARPIPAPPRRRALRSTTKCGREGPLRPAGHHQLDCLSGVAWPAPVEHVLQRAKSRDRARNR